MAKICPLFSGSSGNCTYVGYGDNHILVDMGASARGVCNALKGIGVNPSDISAILITHEHSDHTSALKVFLKNHNIPVYASKETISALANDGRLPEGFACNEIRGKFTVGNAEITRFATSHDCVGSSGYVFNFSDGTRVAVCTDLGIVTDEIRENLLGCRAVMLESNHDVMMLQNGSYPYPLKRRILSEQGHLSNGACAAELPELVRNGTKRIILAHLSRENNHPSVAKSCSVATLMAEGLVEDKDYTIYVAPISHGEMIVL